MSARRAKKGMSPKTALLLLLGCAAFAFWSWTSAFGTDRSDYTQGEQFAPDWIDDDEEPAIEAVTWCDLLELHGSYDGKVPIRMAFTPMTEVAQNLAAPLVETDLAARWRGQDPPLLRIGVVMVSDAARRAVLDGQVVGLGDHIAEGVIVGIEPGLVRLRWQRRELTYDLDGTAPREFRAEQAMRSAEAAAAGGEDASTEQRTLEEGK